MKICSANINRFIVLRPYRVRERKWDWTLNDSSYLTFEHTILPIMPVKKLYLSRIQNWAWLVCSHFSFWGNDQNVRSTMKVSEVFKLPNKHKIKLPNLWSVCKDIPLSWFQLISPFKTIRIIALNVCKSGSSWIFTVCIRPKVSKGTLVWCL